MIKIEKPKKISEEIINRLLLSFLGKFLNSGINAAEIAPEAIRLNIASGTVNIIIRMSDSIVAPNLEAI